MQPSIHHRKRSIMAPIPPRRTRSASSHFETLALSAALFLIPCFTVSSAPAAESGRDSPIAAPGTASGHFKSTTPDPGQLKGQKALTLADALSIFFQRNLSLVAARFNVDSAEAEKLTARLRPNPEFSLDGEDLPSNFKAKFFQEQEIVAAISFTLELAGKRRRRMESAEANARVARDDFETTMWLLTNNFKRAFFRVVLARTKHELAQANQKTFADILDDNRQLNELGETSGLDLRRLEVEKIRFDVEVANTRRDYEQALRDLRLDLGGDYAQNAYTVSGKLDYQAYEISRTEILMEALASRPDLKAARDSEIAADTEIRLQNAKKVPDLALNIGYKRDFGASEYAYGAGIAIPIFDRNQGERSKALIRKRRAENQKRILTNNVLSDVDKALIGLDIQKQRVDAYQSGVLNRIDEIQALTEESYKAGEASILDLLDSLRSRRETQSSYYDTLLDYQMSALDLELAAAVIIVK